MRSLDAVPTLPAASVPAVDREGMREVDRLMIEEFGIQLIQMMENAGLQLAELARRLLAASGRSGAVAVLAGRGNNGGGGIAAARRLHVWGVPVEVVLAAPRDGFRGVPETQLAAVGRMGVPVHQFDGDLPPAALFVDALIGYGLRGPAAGLTARAIETAERAGAPVVSLDAPSGLDVDSGETLGPAITADATLTLALPKAGLLAPGAAPFTGVLYLADISVPHEVYRRLGLAVPPLFAEGPLVRLT